MKILLFTADVTLGRTITSCLLKAGYKVIRYEDGTGAIDLIFAEKPILIILDIELPGYNSLAIIRNLRSLEFNNRIPVILVGSSIQEEDVLIGLEVGADLCLLEAFHPQVFIARVRSLIRRNESINIRSDLLQ